MNLVEVGKLDVVYFDLEARPGHWIGGDYVSKIVTAGAYVHNEEEYVHVLTHYDYSPQQIVEQIAVVIEDADLVVGHYIRGFDLPLINGELLRHSLQPLSSILSHDTKLDLAPAHGRSKSQQNIAGLLGLEHPKVNVTLAQWEAFNDRQPEGYDIGVERVKGDVLQNREMRHKLMSLGWLNPPQVWSPLSRSKGYEA